MRRFLSLRAKRSNPSKADLKRYRMDCRVAALLAMTSCVVLSSCWTPTGTQKPVEVINYGARGGAGSAGIHTVLKGDTVYTVSQRYNLPLREIIALNNLSAPYNLPSGYRLKLPPPNEYKVHVGDTLNTISKMFGVSVSETARLNNLSDPYIIRQGQILRLPSAQPKLEEEFAANPPPPRSLTSEELEATQAPMKVGAVESEVLPPPDGAVAKSGPFPPQPEAKAVPAESQKTAATAATKPSPAPKIPPRGSGKFMRPVDGKVISNYGPKEGGLHNDGINIKAARGTPVRSAENGVVAYAGSELQGYGNLILVRHADRWMTAYAHLDKILVKKGEVVKVGQSIGTVGATGQVDSPQLHFEIRRGTQAVNPDPYL